MNAGSVKQEAKQFMTVAADSIVEQPEGVEVIYLDYLKQPGEWERLSESAREYVRKRWPGYAPGAATPRISDHALPVGVTVAHDAEDAAPEIISITSPVERNVSVMLCPVGGVRRLTGMTDDDRDQHGELTAGLFAYVRLAVGVDGVERLLDDCEQEMARRAPGMPWTTPDGRVWGDVVIGNTLGTFASLVPGGLGIPGGGAGGGRDGDGAEGADGTETKKRYV